MQGFWAKLFTLINVKLLFTTAYHPQADGQSERTNQTIEIALRYTIALHPDSDWEDLLPSLQAAHNSAVNASTGYSPHKLLYGLELRQPWHLLQQADEPDIAARADAEHSMAWAAMRMKHYYDRRHSPIHFEEDDMVYLKLGDGYTLPANDAIAPKLAQRYAGPYKVLKRVGRLAYQLDFPPGFPCPPGGQRRPPGTSP